MTISRYAGRLAIIALAGLLTACSPAPSTDPVAIADEVRADVRATLENFNARNAERAVRSNAPDGTLKNYREIISDLQAES